jgi:hypothetical protein
MDFSGGRIWLFIVGAIALFFAIAALLIRLMPGPLVDSDYLVAGVIATLVVLLAGFGAYMASGKAGSIFGKKEK